MKCYRVVIPLTMLLSACGPVYRTNYNLLPPPTKEGQLCSMNVKSMSDTCVNNCHQMARSCRSFTPGISAGYGFSNYGRYEGSSFYGNNALLNDRDCSVTQCEDSCLSAARTSHLSCGGTITEQVVCTANCPAPPPSR